MNDPGSEDAELRRLEFAATLLAIRKNLAYEQTALNLEISVRRVYQLIAQRRLVKSSRGKISTASIRELVLSGALRKNRIRAFVASSE